MTDQPPADGIRTLRLGRRTIGTGMPCYIIAEIGVNFNGDLGLAKKTVDAAAESGADAVKFQTYHADEFIATRDLSYAYRTADGRTVTESQYEMFKRLELPYEWHVELARHAGRCGIDFFSTPSDADAADFLESIHVPAFKIASEDLINVRLLDHIARKKAPVFLSTGMGDPSEIANAVALFRKHGHTGLILMHCISAYPAPLHTCHLRKIGTLRRRFGLPAGFSDHTEGWQAPMLSVAAGGCAVEKHFTLDHCLPGPDHKMSADPGEFKKMVEMIRTAETALGSDLLGYDPIEEKGRTDYRRSIVAAMDIGRGEVITEAMLAYKRPGHGLKPSQYKQVIGRAAARPIGKNELILPEFLDEKKPGRPAADNPLPAEAKR